VGKPYGKIPDGRQGGIRRRTVGAAFAKVTTEIVRMQTISTPDALN
jgi:hypothetical protein